VSLPVFVTDAVSGLVAGATFVLDGDEGRHASTVKRLRPDERLALTDGAGTAATCTVVDSGKGTLTVRVDGVEHVDRPTPEITVVQALPKGGRGELAVEMLTEVGVDRIVPWAAARSIAVWRGERADKSLAKWRTASRAAAKQARRTWFPDVLGLATTDEVAALVARSDLGVVLHEDAQVPLAALSLQNVSSVVVVVGPEGGLTDDELTAFAEAEIVRMGSSVLRTSTAGVAAVAALLSRTDRWS
jgi:16S rRNA (uracil1498-N3)-methyltransferase